MMTAWFIGVTLGLFVASWLLYDFLVAAWLRPTYGIETETRTLQRLSSKYIAIPFLIGLFFGLVFGHLFGQF